MSPEIDPQTAIEKKRNLLGVTKAAGSLHLSPEAMVFQKALLQIIKTVCCVCTDDIQGLHETNELQGSGDLGESVVLVLFNPAYNVRCQQDLQNSDDNVINAKDIEAFCDFADYALKHGGHGCNFCPAV